MRYILFFILSGMAFLATGQSYPLSGDVFNDESEPLVYSTVVLLNPADSTLEFFGITNPHGHFDIKNIRAGEYLLQTAFLGYRTYYRDIVIPAEGNSLGAIVMKPKPVDVGEVKVVGEAIPMQIRKDTIEFNAKAFKTNPDDVAEDLLKKLPGVEVDRAGNIKAMGEEVKKLYVDGKEFFGNDPKVATRNVPADALDKVQIYDKHSDESDFTGIDDGTRDKTINLQLKEDKKKALFGDVMAGGATGSHFQGGAKAYRFTDKIQVAALGMMNNINQMGFSFNDYLNFNGGIGSLSGHSGSSMRVSFSSDSSFPIDFGMPVSGQVTSGAGGANFSYSSGANKRIFVSYLGNGSENSLIQTTTSRNYIEDGEFLRSEFLDGDTRNGTHRFNFGWRNRIDSTQNIILDGNISFTNGHSAENIFAGSYRSQVLVNSLDSKTSGETLGTSGNVGGSYILKLGQRATLLKIAGDLLWSGGQNNIRFENLTRYFNPAEEISENQYQDNQTNKASYSGSAGLTRRLGKKFFVEPEFIIGNTVERIERKQGFLSPVALIDTLSPDFEKHYFRMSPALRFRRVSGKSTLAFTLQAESGKLRATLSGQPLSEKSFFYFTPSANFDYEFATGKSLGIFYSSETNTPSASQLLPVANNINSLSVYYGNPELKPEISHQLSAHWIFFDQFSFTSLFVSASGEFTRDKINWSRTVTENFGIINRLTNVENDIEAQANFNFSTPVRKLGIKISLSAEENWNRGLNLVNGDENRYTTLGQRFSLSADNRKKEKWDLRSGMAVSLSKTRFSVQESLNSRYFDLSWFAEIHWAPSGKWNFETTADITRYSAESFGKSVRIPLLGVQISRHFLKNNRATLTLRGYDLLDRNTVIQRFGEMNYLREIRSNTVGRYVMLSFTYRLNRFGSNSGGIDVKMGRR